MSELTKEQKEIMDSFTKIFSGSTQKVTASEVMQGLTKCYKLEMISSLPVPERVVKARMVAVVLEKLGYNAESKLVDGIAENYMMCHVSRSGKHNRARNIIDAFASLFRAELELDKSGNMFTK